MALQADGVYVGAIQEARIRSTVREVAGRATLSPDYIVLINERPSRFAVALGADCVHLR